MGRRVPIGSLLGGVRCAGHTLSPSVWGRSSTASTGCESCDRTGTKSTGRFGGVHRTKDKNLHCSARAEGGATSQWPTAASWMFSSSPGAPGDRRQLTVGSEFKQRGAPVRSAHCFRVSPDPGESWSIAMGSGRRHRQDGAGAIWCYDAPQGRLSRAGEGYSPAVSHVKGRIYLTHPFTVIESTARGTALVAAAQAAARDRGGAVASRSLGGSSRGYDDW